MLDISKIMCIFAARNESLIKTKPKMKKIILVILSVLMGITAFAQDEGLFSLTDAERKLVEQNSDFAFNLFRKTRDTENRVISPLSITYALGMLNNGAEGITREEICQVLSGGQQTDYAN